MEPKNGPVKPTLSVVFLRQSSQRINTVQKALTVVKKKAGRNAVRPENKRSSLRRSVGLSHATFFGVARASGRSTKSSFARMRVPMPSESRWRTEETPREWAFIVAVAYGGSPSLNAPSRLEPSRSRLCSL